MEDIPATPAEIRAVIASVGMTHAEFSRAIGVSYRSLRDWLSGHHAPPAWAEKILRILSADPARIELWTKNGSEK